jgi:hypothetical protein
MEMKRISSGRLAAGRHATGADASAAKKNDPLDDLFK